MLKRNLSVKLAPQRWQDNAHDGAFDVVFTFEEKVFDMVVEGNFDVDGGLLFLAIYYSMSVLIICFGCQHNDLYLL